MIRLNNSYADKDQIKALGGHWNAKEKFWYVPDGADFRPFKQWIAADVFEKLESADLLADREHKPTEILFPELFSVVATNIIIPEQFYTIRADVHDMYEIPSFVEEACYLYTLISEHNLRRTIKAKISARLLGDTDPIDLIDKEIVVSGRIVLYGRNLDFQLKATKIEITGTCSRIAEFERWKKEYAHLFRDTNHLATRPPIIRFSKIGLIANRTTRAYGDFFDKLHSNKFKLDDIIHKNVVMNKEHIIAAIRELNHDNECQMICIIRGGGDPEELMEFSHPDLLQAMASSKIPIVTGIGHKDDELLCDYVAAYNARTPSGAADYLNYVAASVRKESLHKTFSKSHGKENHIDWETRCLEAENKIYELEQEIASLKNQLNENTKKGIIGRIFGWFEKGGSA